MEVCLCYYYTKSIKLQQNKAQNIAEKQQPFFMQKMIGRVYLSLAAGMS